jgi:hypothetical protein
LVQFKRTWYEEVITDEHERAYLARLAALVMMG